MFCQAILHVKGRKQQYMLQILIQDFDSYVLSLFDHDLLWN